MSDCKHKNITPRIELERVGEDDVVRIEICVHCLDCDEGIKLAMLPRTYDQLGGIIAVDGIAVTLVLVASEDVTSLTEHNDEEHTGPQILLEDDRNI